jgi:hypothetical protein
VRERSDDFPRLGQFHSTTTRYEREVLVGGTWFSCAVLTVPARLPTRNSQIPIFSGWRKVGARAQRRLSSTTWAVPQHDDHPKPARGFGRRNLVLLCGVDATGPTRDSRFAVSLLLRLVKSRCEGAATTFLGLGSSRVARPPGVSARFWSAELGSPVRCRRYLPDSRFARRSFAAAQAGKKCLRGRGLPWPWRFLCSTSKIISKFVDFFLFLSSEIYSASLPLSAPCSSPVRPGDFFFTGGPITECLGVCDAVIYMQLFVLGARRYSQRA